ncbi:transaldolase [Candidatus Peregrinibacteria bacterium CG_4_9_14_0_2_um_filter_38_9]|nr:MAG: transaldolase [Candidatus Peregrinibacteria bacterium CG_4_9_14_0_2_um_filter_38_9]
MTTNSLIQLEILGQSIWLDYIKRDLFKNGKFKQLISDYGLRGMTSNPSIFEKAISESDDYNQDIKKMSDEKKELNTIYEALTQKDVQDAADAFRALYDETDGQDGYVSLEVNPHLAHDTNGTIIEARHLWHALNRPNVFIKVPATKAGLPAITQLISEGINVNVTLLFGLPRYKEVAQAYMAGIEARISLGKPVKKIASVASFFLSRIDVLLDPIFTKYAVKQAEKLTLAKELQGQIAIASAKMAYQIYDTLFKSDRFKKLEATGAHVQRLLWASTSTKNPDYSDIKYVEALIGPETVNTLPLETIKAYRDHGNPELRLTLNLDKAKKYFQQLSEFDIDIDALTQQLENEGVDKFAKSYDQLMETLKNKITE